MILRPTRRGVLKGGAALAASSVLPLPAIAQARTIKIGNTMPYSGPASAYGQIGMTIGHYLEKLNADGGVNGVKFEWISYDDGYSPPKTFEQTQRLVESDEVHILSSSLGTPTVSAVNDYTNAMEIPLLFVSSGASKWGQPQTHPWTMGWQPDYVSEGRIYGRYVLEERPEGKVGILYQNDDYGKDYVNGFKDALGEKASMIVAEEPYEVSEPTIDSQIIKLKSAGADVFLNITTPKFAAQAIRKVAELGWTPLHLLNNVSQSVGAVLQPAGLENSRDIVSASYAKDPTDPAMQDDETMQAMHAFLDQYYPDADRASSFTVFGYGHGLTLEHLFKQLGDDLSREAIMQAAANLDFPLGTLRPGVTIKTSPTDFYPIQSMWLTRFDGNSWVAFGDVISGAAQGS
ncbi:ABC transporter substrate-binding protein [Acuticoccus sp. I52.16.1]|uniref:ABC transporter substrate-binding protein n=1 Tax=Acuticoccus sp. I52.16.1 TaxID=2928472 RepID=UPI001FD422BF|nr:ABC transporter substrate-binding protein [Acuticoccus sp. I52.16.1]UOM33623.1 ABC transporter substrate-binding protein [Acuticoccus sp. I52.16.1]